MFNLKIAGGESLVEFTQKDPKLPVQSKEPAKSDEKEDTFSWVTNGYKIPE